MPRSRRPSINGAVGTSEPNDQNAMTVRGSEDLRQGDEACRDRIRHDLTFRRRRVRRGDASTSRRIRRFARLSSALFTFAGSRRSDRAGRSGPTGSTMSHAGRPPRARPRTPAAPRPSPSTPRPASSPVASRSPSRRSSSGTILAHRARSRPRWARRDDPSASSRSLEARFAANASDPVPNRSTRRPSAPPTATTASDVPPTHTSGLPGGSSGPAIAGTWGPPRQARPIEQRRERPRGLLEQRDPIGDRGERDPEGLVLGQRGPIARAERQDRAPAATWHRAPRPAWRACPGGRRVTRVTSVPTAQRRVARRSPPPAARTARARGDRGPTADRRPAGTDGRERRRRRRPAPRSARRPPAASPGRR